MSKNATKPAILVVDDDEVISQVLSRVLTRDDRTILQATNATQGLELANQYHPHLALVDLCLPDIDGVELAKGLRSRHANMPVILMTAYPLRLRDHPEMGDHFTCVLTKPLNLKELSHTVDVALAGQPEPPKQVPTATPIPEKHTSFAQEPRLDRVDRPERMDQTAPLSRSLIRVAFSVAALLVVAICVSVLTGTISIPGLASAETTRSYNRSKPLPRVELVIEKKNTLEVPKETRLALGMVKNDKPNVAIGQPPAQGRTLEIPGSTFLDVTRLTPIRIRFAPAEVIEFGTRVTPDEAGSRHELRSGDRVYKREADGKPTLLLVLWSSDVGEKKRDLVDALLQLELDKRILKGMEELRKTGSVPEIQYWTALKAVRGDETTVRRAEGTLRTWRIPEEDIRAVHEEAERLWQKGGLRDAQYQQLEKAWPRVELRAPDDGIIIERNLGGVGQVIVDNTLNLFQIAKVDRLLVQANAQEDDLPALHALKREQMRWTVETIGEASITTLTGPIAEIGYVLDPNQHTAPVKGYIDNPGELIRAGQFITAKVNLSAPKGVIEIPASALIDDGKQSVVFVLTDAAKHQYTMRRVKVTHRFENSVFVQSKSIPKEEQLTETEAEEGFLRKEPLVEGESVLLSGAGELKAALLSLQSEKEANGDKH
jgi:cobalt-zinc-cadmium efflux system membrane fusion protein